jgi:hypothetical protein
MKRGFCQYYQIIYRNEKFPLVVLATFKYDDVYMSVLLLYGWLIRDF